MNPEWLPLIAAIATGAITPIVIKWMEQRSQKKQSDAQAQEILSEGWERLGQEYARLLENTRRDEAELVQLRPLTLKIALQEKEMEQVKEDKEDWKRYAGKLEQQLKDANIIPIPFRRYPGNGDSEKHKVVTQSKITAIRTEEAQ